MSLHESDVGQDEWYQISKKIWRMWLRFKNTLWIISPGASSSSPGSLLAPPSSLVFINFLVKKNNSKTPLLLYCLLTFCLYQTPPEYRLFKLFLQANFTDVSHYADIAEWKSPARSEVWLWLTPAPIHTGCTHYYSQQRVISVILLLSICRCITILSHLGSDKHQKRLFSLTYRSSVRV